MTKPSFYQPLLKIETALQQQINNCRTLKARIAAHNSDSLKPLLEAVEDAQACFMETYSMLTKARSLEKEVRTNKR